MENSTENFEEKLSEIKQIKCKDCGAVLTFEPGTENLKCQYCGAENKIEASIDNAFKEVDFFSFLENTIGSSEKIDITNVKCAFCGATTTLKPNITADDCPYCGHALVVSNGTTSKIIKPQGVLPFAIKKEDALQRYREWVKSLWFAPNDLKKYADTTDKLVGIYMPYFTFDSNTFNKYLGARGDYYYTTESYTDVVDGKSVTKTRQVRHTRWTTVSGKLDVNFDDMLVPASQSLPLKYIELLEPWDLKSLVDYNDSYLSGFKAESYQLELKDAFEYAKDKMKTEINKQVRMVIGGDEQRVDDLNTNYSDVSFKYILLPLWISAFQYNNKPFRFLINARTGEVQGERPYSVIKIVSLAILVLVILLLIIFNAN